MTEMQSNLDDLCINTIRTLSMDAIQKANSGHPGAPMGLAPAAYVLWTRYMKHNPENPAWLDRDRFVLSGGHASMLLYSLLHLSGYGLSLDEIKNFRQMGSKTPGHPEFGHTVGVETTTGPLGQGFANAVGMAMAERHLAATYNKPGHEIVDHHTYVMCGDGDLMEGVASEAASLAGHLKLGKLICLYDDNKISIEGTTDIAFTEDVEARFKAYNWNTIRVENGNDPEKVASAIEAARAQSEKPTLILTRTSIAFGSPNKQDSSDAHGAPLGEEEIRLTKKNLGWPEDKSFYVPEEVQAHFDACKARGAAAESAWSDKFSSYKEAYPEETKSWVDAMCGFLPQGWDELIPNYTHGDDAVATRAASGKVLNAIAEKLPTLIGGSADLAPSNKTYMNCSEEFQAGSYDARNIRFGVREHAMGSIMSGMYLHNGVRPFGGTFLVFADYMRPAIRVASLMKLPMIYVFTHDSVAVGEDGPTHQPVEHLASLRTIPGISVIRPADAAETAAAWRVAVRSTDKPVALIMSRQKLPILDNRTSDGVLANGGYVLEDCKGTPDVILIATGSEVHISVDAKKILEEKGVKARVVSMPCWDLFDQMPQNYKDRILPPAVTKRLAVEAGISMGWEKYVGTEGATLSIEEFGASAPGGQVLAKFGYSAENVAEKAMELVK